MKNKVYPSIKDAILLLLVFWAAYYGFGKLNGALISALKISGGLFIGVLNFINITISFGLVLLIGFKKSKREFNAVFKFNKVPLFLWAAATVFIIGFDILLSDYVSFLTPFFPISERLLKFSKEVDGQYFIIVVIRVVIIGTAAEEMLFRGLILGGLKTRYTNRKAVIISALLFGLYHFNPFQFCLAFVMGLFSAWLCIRTGSILLSIYLHMYYNLTAMVFFRFRNIVTIPGYNVITSYFVYEPFWFHFTGLVLFILGIVLLKKGFKKQKLELNRPVNAPQP